MIVTSPDEMRVARSLPHGHVAAVLGTLRQIALDRLILEHGERRALGDLFLGSYAVLIAALRLNRQVSFPDFHSRPPNVRHHLPRPS